MAMDGFMTISGSAALAKLQSSSTKNPLHGRRWGHLWQRRGHLGSRPSWERQTRPVVSNGLAAAFGSAGGLPWMASYTSWRWTGTSLGATIPSRTLSPRISTTVTVMSLLMTILSFFFLDSTSIAAYPSLRQGQS